MRRFFPLTVGTLLSSALFISVLTPNLAVAEQISVRVSSGIDDVEQRSNGYMYVNSSDLELTTDRSYVQTVGIRFRNVQIPAGATITNAWLEFETDEVSTGAANLTIRGHAHANSSAFTTSSYNLTSRPRTVASTRWYPSEWPVVSAKHRSPSVAAVVQEVINKTGWQSGNALTFIVSGTGRRAAESYNGERQNAPLLTVQYEVVAPDPGVVSGIVWQDANLNGNRDNSDPLVSGITVSLNNCETGETDQLVTNASGQYSFTTEPSSCYTVKVDAPDDHGFATGSGSDVSESGITAAFALSEAGYIVKDAGIYKLQIQDSGRVDVRVTSGMDDVEERSNGWMYTNSSDLELTTDGSQVQTVGLRFNGVDIPAGATINDAYLEFEVDEVSTGTTNLAIRAEARANASAFTTAYYNVTTRPRTSASATWNNVPAWTSVNGKHQSPSLAAVVQEIVSLDGWQSGNSMAFMISGSGRRTAESYNGEPAAAPRLVIDWVLSNEPTGLVVVEPVSDTVDHIVYRGEAPAAMFQWDLHYNPATSQVAPADDVTHGELSPGVNRYYLYAQNELSSGTILARVTHSQADHSPVSIQQDEVADSRGEIFVSNIDADESARGDINCDGKATVTDLALITMRTVGIDNVHTYCATPGQLDLVAGDINCNGGVDIVDALLLSRQILGISTYVCTGSVSGHYWQDNNRDGLENSGDTAVVDAMVTLENCNTGETWAGSTDANGDVEFTVAVGDCYTLNFSSQSGYEFVVGGDSDVNSSGLTPSFAISTTSSDRYDAGRREVVVLPKPLPDFIWKKTIHDMGVVGVPGSTEMSSVTINPISEQMLMISDAGYLYIYDMDVDDEPVEASAKYYRLGAGDWEGIVWMYDEVYAIVTERTSIVRVLDFSSLPAVGSTLPLGVAPMLIAEFHTGHEVCSGCNGGWEGIAFDPTSIEGVIEPNSANWVFYLIDESSTEVFKYQRVGNVLNKLWNVSLEMGDMTDGSDIFLSRSTDDLYILSDETRRVKQYAVNGNSLDYVDTVSIYVSGSGLTDPEGIVFSADMQTMYIVSEGNSRLGIFR